MKNSRLGYIKIFTLQGLTVTIIYLLFLAIVCPPTLIGMGTNVNEKISNYDDNEIRELCKDLVRRYEAYKNTFIFHFRIWMGFLLYISVTFTMNLIHMKAISQEQTVSDFPEHQKK